MRTFLIGDIHGAHLALKQCLERSNFNKEEDLLITIGDIADGWPFVFECVEELLTIKNRIDIKGNHDEWLDRFFKYGVHPVGWEQGGHATMTSYNRHLGIGNPPYSHMEFFHKQHLYYLDDNNRLFIHGGFDNRLKLHGQPKYVYYWDRQLFEDAVACPDKKIETVDNFTEIFIGHTATTGYKTDKPMNLGHILWNVDTGAGWYGKLTIMDVNTKEYWQSDNTDTLYDITSHNFGNK